MHTYSKNKNREGKQWVVWCTTGTQEDIRYFEHEIQAIQFVNFLNGGNQDISLIKEMIEV